MSYLLRVFFCCCFHRNYVYFNFLALCVINRQKAPVRNGQQCQITIVQLLMENKYLFLVYIFFYVQKKICDNNLWKCLSYYFGINCTTHRSNFASYNLELFILECNIYFQDRFTNVYFFYSFILNLLVVQMTE